MKTVVFSGAMPTMTLFKGTFIGYSNFIYNMAQKVRNFIFVSGIWHRKSETSFLFLETVLPIMFENIAISAAATSSGGNEEKGDSYCSNLSQQPWQSLAKKPKATHEDKQYACQFFMKTFLTTLGMGLNKKRKEKVRILIEKRLSKCANKKIAKTALKTYLFLMRLHICNITRILISSFHCLLTKCKRMAEKGDFLSEFWLSLHAKDDQRKVEIFDKQLTFEPPKVLETSQQSTRNLALCVISMGWEKKKVKEHFYHFKLWWQVLT